MGNVLPLIPVRSEVPQGEGLVISCDDCAHQHTSQCDDCVVSFICGGIEEKLVLGGDERRALRLLADAGLTPELRLTSRAG
jgi:hypothetical protein